MRILFWGLYFPLLKILGLFVSWLPEFQERIRFERKNLGEDGAKSFRDAGLAAHLCFEFASEGEFQQVASLIEDALGAGKRIELVFFSPSVEAQILALAEKYPEQIRYLRYPLLSFSPSSVRRCFLRWITAPRLILVRYDLFPEFLLWSQKNGNHLKLVWFTFKKEREKNRAVSRYKQLFLKHANTVIFATPEDQMQGSLLGRKGRVYDFRIEQIHRRLLQREAKFSTHLPAYPALRELLQRFAPEKRLVFGNVWPRDLHLLELLPSDVLVFILPHKLDPDTIEEMSDQLEALGRPPQLIASDQREIPGPGTTYLLTSRGVLCELYQDFERAYVGGGFGESVHSILEPLVAGCRFIAAGPLHHRSTEFDLAEAAGVMTEVHGGEDFNRWFMADQERRNPIPLVAQFLQEYENFKEDILSC